MRSCVGVIVGLFALSAPSYGQIRADTSSYHMAPGPSALDYAKGYQRLEMQHQQIQLQRQQIQLQQMQIEREQMQMRRQMEFERLQVEAHHARQAERARPKSAKPSPKTGRLGAPVSLAP